jgi:N-acetylglucosamine kinase-like BadF-type ATPase
VANASQLVTTIYAPEFTRAKIAALAPEILAACTEAPETCAQLLMPAGVALAETVAAVSRSLGWYSGELPLAMAGGFLLAAPVVQRVMLDDLARQGYQVTATPVADPVRGAVILAERALVTS